MGVSQNSQCGSSRARWKHPWSFLSAVVLAISILVGCAPQTAASRVTDSASTGQLANVLKSGVLVIATDGDYAPQSKLNSGVARAASSRCDLTQYTANQLEGFDIDVASAIASRLGVEPCFVTPTWSQIVSGSWGDRWNVNVGSMVITADRMQKLYFTQPYVSGQAVLFVHKDNQTFHTPTDLSGKRIGVCSGCAYEAYLDGTLNIPGEKIDFQIKNARVIGYDTDTSALADLALGDGARLEAAMTDPDTGSSMIRNGLPIKQLEGAVYHDYSAVTVDKSSVGNPIPLVQRISSIIQELHRDGTLLKLSQKYYGGDFTTPAAKFDLQALAQFP